MPKDTHNTIKVHKKTRGYAFYIFLFIVILITMSALGFLLFAPLIRTNSLARTSNLTNTGRLPIASSSDIVEKMPRQDNTDKKTKRSRKSKDKLSQAKDDSSKAVVDTQSTASENSRHTKSLCPIDNIVALKFIPEGAEYRHPEDMVCFKLSCSEETVQTLRDQDQVNEIGNCNSGVESVNVVDVLDGCDQKESIFHDCKIQYRSCKPQSRMPTEEAHYCKSCENGNEPVCNSDFRNTIDYPAARKEEQLVIEASKNNDMTATCVAEVQTQQNSRA